MTLNPTEHLSKTNPMTTTSEQRPASPRSLSCLSIIMPVYNEVFTLKHVIKRVLDVPLPKELIIVDDCSKDGTTALLKEIAAHPEIILSGYPNAALKIFFHEINQGKGAALRTGIKQATGDITIIQDADMEYDPGEYPKLIEPILAGDADVVFGSRFRGERVRVHRYWHYLGNKFLTLLSNMATNLHLTDMETCYKVFKTEIIKSIPLRSNRFGFEPEVTAKVSKLRCTIYEIPILYKGRSYDEGKKINWKDGVSALWTIFKFWLIDDLYDDTAGLRTLRIMQGAGRYNKWLFEQCKPYLGRRVLELGAGVGNLTKFLIDRDAVIATDIVDFYLAELRRNLQQFKQVQVVPFNLLESGAGRQMAAQFKPDTVLAVNVLEHIKDQETAFKTIFDSLSPGGRLVLVSPAHESLFSEMDNHLGHFRRYSRASLTSLLEKTGFQVESSRYFNMLAAIGWFVNGKIFRRKLIPSRQLRLFDAFIKILNVEKVITPPFGFSVVAVAKKGA